MQTALEEAGLPFLKTINTASEKEVLSWIKKNGLEHFPLIIKPPISAGSDKVFHISVNQDWKKAFNQVLQEPSKTTGEKSKTVVVQEQALGFHYSIHQASW